MKQLCFLLLWLLSSPASAGTLPHVSGIKPALFRIEGVVYAVKDSLYVAQVDAYIAPELNAPGTSFLLNDHQPLPILNHRSHFEVTLHPGPNTVSLMRVGNHGEVLNGSIEINPAPHWIVSPSCGRYGVRWEDIQAPVASHFEVSCLQSGGSSGSVTLTFQGVEVHDVYPVSGKELARTAGLRLPAWQTVVPSNQPAELELGAHFGATGALRSRAKLIFTPRIPFTLHAQISAGAGLIAASQTDVSTSSIEPHLSAQIYAPLWNGHFETRLELGIGSNEATVRPLLRWLPRSQDAHPRLAPFVDLALTFEDQFSAANPIAPAPIFIPMPGLGLEWQMSRTLSLAIAGHAMLLQPSIGGSQAPTPTSSLDWDAGLWLGWMTGPTHGTLWFLRTRYFTAPISGGGSFTGNWSTFLLELGWGGSAGSWNMGGLGVGL